MSDIVNVGICTVDAIARTLDDYPPRGGLRLFDSLTLTTGGNAVNCSVALAKLGVACDVIVKTGPDTLGDFILAELKQYGIGTAGVVRDEHTHTPFTFVVGHEDGQRSFIHTLGTNGTFEAADVDLSIVERAKFCFVTGTMVMPTLDGEQTAVQLRAGALLRHRQAFVSGDVATAVGGVVTLRPGRKEGWPTILLAVLGYVREADRAFGPPNIQLRLSWDVERPIPVRVQ